MLDRYFDDGMAILPEGLQTLRAVYDELMVQHHFGPDSKEAADLAKSIVSLFKAGFRSADELRHMAL